MNLPLFIAGRYLFARKSHNVINVISAVSAIGMALGTAALVLILSVYNGFNSIIDRNLSDFDPDVRIADASGGFNLPSDADIAPLLEDPDVESYSHSLEFNAFLTYGEGQGAAHIVGTDGDISLHRGDVKLAAVGAGLARKLGINPRFLDPLVIYSPDREKKISLADPMVAMHVAEVYPDRLFSVNAEIDEGTVLIPLETAQELFGIEGVTSSLDIRLSDNSDKAVRNYIKRHQDSLGPGFVMKDKYGQHPELYRMMRLEKAAVFLILLFVVLIVALNIFGSLSMLIVEKQNDISTLSALGADGRTIRRIFIYEGWLVSLLGMAVGLVVGVALALLQQRFGLVKMPGNYLVDAYPVVLKLRDVLLSAAGVAVVGLLISLASSRDVEIVDNN